jgi:hypothetical protein
METLSAEEDMTHLSCTIARTPRTPAHCIQYVALVTWTETFGSGTSCPAN